ncbi:MAG: inner membrane protein [Glaciecola sp.]|jgi:inner membrane protein
MEIIEKPNKNKFGNLIKTSITTRMLMVGALVLILLIPLIYIEDLIRERSIRQQSVINEINQQWGNEVLLNGPVLQIPYKVLNEKTITDAITKQVFTETV